MARLFTPAAPEASTEAGTEAGSAVAAPDLRLAEAVRRLTAIAHEGRLRLMRLLVQAGPEGVLAGTLARKAGVAATTASAQLLVLANAELVTAQRLGRQVVYRANYPALTGLLGYLLEDCCGGRSEVCEPLAERLRGQQRMADSGS